MKSLIKFSLLSVLLACVYGCATNSGDVRLDPPPSMNSAFLKYKELPGQKVFVVAVDTTGEWCLAYDHSRETVEEAAVEAATLCDAQRSKMKVFTKAKIYAINDEVVYYDYLKQDK